MPPGSGQPELISAALTSRGDLPSCPSGTEGRALVAMWSCSSAAQAAGSAVLCVVDGDTLNAQSTNGERLLPEITAAQPLLAQQAGFASL